MRRERCLAGTECIDRRLSGHCDRSTTLYSQKANRGGETGFVYTAQLRTGIYRHNINFFLVTAWGWRERLSEDEPKEGTLRHRQFMRFVNSYQYSKMRAIY